MLEGAGEIGGGGETERLGHARVRQPGFPEQKARLERNTRQFVAGHGANNVLLTGARGTGKSSLIKGVLLKFAGKGLRLIEGENTGHVLEAIFKALGVALAEAFNS